MCTYFINDNIFYVINHNYTKFYIKWEEQWVCQWEI